MMTGAATAPRRQHAKPDDAYVFTNNASASVAIVETSAETEPQNSNIHDNIPGTRFIF
jgi:hypothetical protein